jgi:hypothetical protein
VWCSARHVQHTYDQGHVQLYTTYNHQLSELDETYPPLQLDLKASLAIRKVSTHLLASLTLRRCFSPRCSPRNEAGTPSQGSCLHLRRFELDRGSPSTSNSQRNAVTELGIVGDADCIAQNARTCRGWPVAWMLYD